MTTPIATNLPGPVVSNVSPITERSTSTPTRVRSSRFIETPMEEYTPANSIYETDDDALAEWDGTRTRVLMRAANAICHLIVCALPMAIAAEFLARQAVWWSKSTPNSIALLAILSLDILLDFLALLQITRRRPGWALLARLAVGIAYLVLFMVYVALGYAFPPGYSYWGIQPMYAGPVAYLFMWALGVWNLLNTALHRHQVGRDVREWGARWSGMRVDGVGAPRAGPRAGLGEERVSRGWFGRVAIRGRRGGDRATHAEEGRRNEIRLSESRRAEQEAKTDVVTAGTAGTTNARRPEEIEGDAAVRSAPVAAVDDRARS